MTSAQRNQINAYRRNGMKYAEIARRVNLPETTIKSYCYRHPMQEYTPDSNTGVCPQCGIALPPAKFKPRRFCSDACRNRYWLSHAEDINRKTAATGTCAYCGKQFRDYACRGRKYCSHACYIAARYGGEQHE